MRNDTARWAPPVNAPAQIDFEGLTLAMIAPPHLTLISGPDVLTRFPDAIGWPTAASGPAYRLCLRRDRIVEVGHAPRADGWHRDRAWAVSDITSGTALFEITGARTGRLVRALAEITEATPSRSVSRLLLGHDVLCYRYGAEGGYRLHVKRAEAAGIWTALHRAAERLE